MMIRLSSTYSCNRSAHPPSTASSFIRLQQASTHKSTQLGAPTRNARHSVRQFAAKPSDAEISNIFASVFNSKESSPGSKASDEKKNLSESLKQSLERERELKASKDASQLRDEEEEEYYEEEEEGEWERERVRRPDEQEEQGLEEYEEGYEGYEEYEEGEEGYEEGEPVTYERRLSSLAQEQQIAERRAAKLQKFNAEALSETTHSQTAQSEESQRQQQQQQSQIKTEEAVMNTAGKKTADTQLEEVVDEEGDDTELLADKTLDSLNSLKYLSMYPKQVRRWVIDARLPKGYYNVEGDWEFAQEEEPIRDNLPPINPHDPEAYYKYAYYDKLRQDLLAYDRPEKKKKETAAEEKEEEATEDASSTTATAGKVHKKGGLNIQVREVKESDVDQGVPLDLRGNYRFGIQPDEVKHYPPKLRELLSFKYANQPEINRFRINAAIKKWQRKSNDTGSAEVEVAILTERINYLTEHLTRHRHDKHSKRGFVALLYKRRTYLKYLRKKNAPLYYKMLKELNLRDVYWEN